MKQGLVGAWLLALVSVAPTVLAQTQIAGGGTVNFTGQVNVASCSVSVTGGTGGGMGGGRIDVSLGVASSADLRSQAQDPQPGIAKEFTLALTCPTGFAPTGYFSADSVSGQGLQVSGGAQGVSIMLVVGVSPPIKLDLSSGKADIPDSKWLWDPTSYYLPMKAYYALAPNVQAQGVQAGKADGVLNYTMSYR